MSDPPPSLPLPGQVTLSEGQNLVLVGYRGSGKSWLGRRVAAALERPFFDLDAEIEITQGRSISSIFEKDGEDVFRDLESGTLSGVLRRRGLVVSPGGGVVLRESNRALLQRQCTVYLAVAADALVERLRRSPGRPPLTEHPLEQEVLSNLAARQRYYREVSGLVLDVSGDERPPRTLERLLALIGVPGKDGV